MSLVSDISEHITIDDALLTGAGTYVTRVGAIFFCVACGDLFRCFCDFPQSHSGQSMILERERRKALADIVARQLSLKPCPICGVHEEFIPVSPTIIRFDSKEFLE
ncbi:MAG: hypothetical protein ABID61_02540 [Candidatus Micrarchaeota archaeon]